MRRVPATLAIFLLVVHAYIGVGFTTGPPRFSASGSFAVVEMWASIQAWGVLFLLGALASVPTLLHRGGMMVALGHILAALPLLAFGTGLAAALIMGVSEGFGGAALYALPAALHCLLARLAWDGNPQATRGT